MAYSEFAFFYDELNQDADYNRLFAEIEKRLHGAGISKGILVDLGCGTGELTLRLLQAGYDMIGVDVSEEMLSVAAEKQCKAHSDKAALLLCQNIIDLDLYGTVQGMLSTFDTLNHLSPAELETAFLKISLFLEKDSVFIFDMNTPYKHTHILKNHLYTLAADDGSLICRWKNTLDAANCRTRIDIHIEGEELSEPVNESFYEYYYSLTYIQSLCSRYGLDILTVDDGETFGTLRKNSARMLITAMKRYTQNEREENDGHLNSQFI